MDNQIRKDHIISKVSSLLPHLASPREGHLYAAAHVMAYFCQKYTSRLVFGPSHPEIDHSVSKKYHWPMFYQDAEEAIPVNTQEH